MRKYGWKPGVKDPMRDRVYEKKLISLPSLVDLRNQCPPVYDQGNLGSCTANAIAGAIEFNIDKEKLPDFVPSRLFIYYNERAIEGTIRSDSGAMIKDGIKSVVKQGVCDEKLWPYNVLKYRKKPCPKYYDAALQNIVEKYELLSDPDSYKNVLASGYPFVFGFSVYQSFESDAVARSGIVPMPVSGERFMGGHAVLAVGYDDVNNWFIVRNSWGALWGVNGYFFLPYEYFTPNLTDDFWTITFVK